MEHGTGRYIIKGQNAGGHPVGTICYRATAYDYGLAGDDTRFSGHQHVSVTLRPDGGYPLFTIRVDHLEVAPDEDAAGVSP